MRIPDLTLKEVEAIVQGVYAMAEDCNVDPDYVIANTAYHQGIQAARVDFLSALESVNEVYAGILPSKDILDDLRKYILSNQSL